MAKAQKSSFVFSEPSNVNHYDWRLAVVTTLAEAWRSPSGKMHEAGTPGVAVCDVAYDDKRAIRFNMPSVCALLLDYAHRLWEDSADVLGELHLEEHAPLPTPTDDAKFMHLLERRMAIVVFSYTAIEAFANEMIEEAYKNGYVYSSKNPKTDAPYTLEEIERYMELETKLCGVLTEIAKVKTPKGTAPWQRFGQMRKIRHFIIHPKQADKIQVAPESKVLWKMLTDSQFRDFASDAKALMMHYAADGAHPARWLFKCPF